MAYLGQTAHESTLANRVTNTMTGDGSDTTLTLSSAPISVNNVIVFIDGVMQRPTTDYTVSGTTLTFAAAPHNSAKVQAIIGGGEHIGVPLAPITEEQLVDGVVTSAKLESGIQIPADKITSLAASKLSGALPALDGGNLTGMSPTTVGIDNVTTNPSPTTNPSGGVGTIHLNKTTGEMFVCTNATANNNIWFNVGEGSGDITNTAPTNPTSTNSFPDLNQNTSNTFTFSGATDADGSVTHYMVDQISNAALTVTAAEVAAGSAHTFATGTVGSDTAVTFRVRSKDNDGAYSSGVTVSLDVLNVVYTVATSTNSTNANGITNGDYKYHLFNQSGTFTISQIGTDADIDFLVVAGGGGGGAGPGDYYGNGGGGAGGYRTTVGTSGGGGSESAITGSVTSYTITVGAGGAGAIPNGSDNHGDNGSNSSIAALLVSTGGGGGGSSVYSGGTAAYNYANLGRSNDGADGGSGGGANGYHSVDGKAISPTQGYDGGTNWGASADSMGYGGAYNSPGSGGGGAGSQGGDRNSNTHATAGGNGQSSTITGSSITRGGGGGGSTYANSNAGAGGSGGGGAGGQPANSGSANLGGGGGAGRAGYNSGAGGSGVVIVRYKYQN